MKPIDFSRSYAILVGTGRYTNGLEKMPQAINSLHAMRDLLVDVCGWPSSRVKVFADKTTGDKVDVQITRFIHDATDVVLFYYVGHGQLLDGGQLGMALVDTHRDGVLRRRTSLRFNDVREELHANRQARIKLTVLDCCFSGLATKNTQGADLADQIQQITKIAGSYTLTASQHWQKAHHAEGRHELTHFTKVFADIVRNGIPGRGPYLTLKDIHEGITDHLAHLPLPHGEVPQQPSTLVADTAEKLRFVHNAAHVEEIPNRLPGSVRPDAMSLVDANTSRSPAEALDSAPAMGPAQRLLASIAGARLDVLMRTPVDRFRYVSMGGVLLTTATLATLSAVFALTTAVDLPLTVALTVSFVWGLVVLNLDRLLVITMTRRRLWTHGVLVALPRIVLAGLLGTVVSVPLVLRIFHHEIESEMVVMRAESIAEFAQQVADSPPYDRIPDLEDDRDKNMAKADQNPNSLTADAARAEATRIQHELDDLQEQRDASFEAHQAAVEANSGLLSRLEALSSLSTRHPSMGVAQTFLFILFLTVEVLPVIVKLLQLGGPPTVYDTLIAKMEADAAT